LRAFAVIRSLYCASLPLWLGCSRGFCRRHRRCGGDRFACLPRAWPLLPEAVQERARAEVALGGRRRIAPESETERQLRVFPASNFVRPRDQWEQ
jgi:hypothetical protein